MFNIHYSYSCCGVLSSYKNFIIMKQFYFFLVCLFAAINMNAEDLITKQITIKLEKAGTLSDRIGSTRKYQLTNLKIVGEINGSDVSIMRDMTGANGVGNLENLDLSEAKVVEGGASYYRDVNRNLYTEKNVIGEYFFYACPKLKTIILPLDVTFISSEAFSYCSSLTSVTIPSSVTRIGWRAFYGCRSLKTLTIPSSVTDIDNNAFENCSGLTNITLPLGITLIESDTFSGCSGLSSVTIPSSVKRIWRGAFWGCSSLTTITIPSSVIFIGDYAFQDCI